MNKLSVPFVLWFTGFSGAGKSTIAQALADQLSKMDINTFNLDGDVLRTGLNKDLGFRDADRSENIRRVGEVAKLFLQAGILPLVTLISPFREDRDSVRSMFESGKFIEVYVKCALEECERRDVKGLYKQAREGSINYFTGISSPYEEPDFAELVVETDKLNIQESVEIVINYLVTRGLVEIPQYMLGRSG